MMFPLTHSLKKALIPLLHSQAQVIDQVSLLLTLKRGELLENVLFFENIFLMSSSSDFITNLTNSLVMNCFERIQGNDGTYHSQAQISSLWKQDSLQETFNRCLQSSAALLSLKPQSFIKANINILESNVQLPGQYCSLFIPLKPQAVSIVYEASWPFEVFFPADVMKLFSSVSCRLLSLGHLNALAKMVWCELKNQRHLRSPASIDVSFKSIDRSMYSWYRELHSIIRFMIDFSSNRFRVISHEFRSSLIDASASGVSGMIESVKSYATQLSNGLFCNCMSTAAASASLSSLKSADDAFDALILFCLRSFEELLDIITSIRKDMSSVSVPIQVKVGHVKQILQGELPALKDKLRHVARVALSSHSRLHAEALLMYISP